LKTSLEVTLVHALSVSQLKVAQSCLSASSSNLMISISSNLIGTRSSKEQAESPLLNTLVQYQAKQGQLNGFLSQSGSNIGSQCFANYITLQTMTHSK